MGQKQQDAIATYLDMCRNEPLDNGKLSRQHIEDWLKLLDLQCVKALIHLILHEKDIKIKELIRCDLRNADGLKRAIDIRDRMCLDDLLLNKLVEEPINAT